MENEYALTIAIPTYNRLGYLKHCIKSVLDQIPTPGGGVEFFISDNASTDGTQEYMKELSAKYPFVGYYRNDENVGADNNFIKCLNRAKGKYTLLLGDDDVLLPGAIDAILKGVESEPVFALLNMNNYFENTNEVTLYDDRNRFIMNVCVIAFISNMLYRTDLAKKVQLKKSYYELNYIAIANETLKTNGTYMTINYPCVQSNDTLSISEYDVYKILDVAIELCMEYINDDVDFDAFIYNNHRLYMTSLFFHLIFARKNFKNQSEESKQNYLKKLSKIYPDLYPIYKYILTCPLSELDDREKIKEMLQKRRVEYLKEYCLKYDKIYIYGAGYWGEHIFEKISKNGGAKNITGIVVSDGQNKGEFHSLPIFYASELSKLDKDFGVIVAMRYSLQIDVFFTLKSMGLLNRTYFCDWL